MLTPTLPTVAHVDLRRYLGRWFEIARLPMRTQDDECTDVVTDYSQGVGNQIQIRSQCTLDTGCTRASHGVAIPSAGDGARWKTSFAPSGLRWLPFASRSCWILRLAPDYSMSLVGTPRRLRLWLLSRTRVPPPAQRDEYLAHAAAIGFDLTALIHTRHVVPVVAGSAAPG